MNRRFLMIACVLAVVFVSPVSWARSVPVAVIDMQNLGGIDQQQLNKASDLFIGAVEQMSVFRIIDRSVVQKALADMKKCSDDACLASLGRSVSARWLASGSIMRFGGTYVLKLRMIDVKAGKSITSTTNQVKDDWNAVMTMLPKAVASLFASAAPKLNPSAVAVPKKKPVHERTTKEQKKVDEFERMLANAERTKEAKKRTKNAWKAALKLASDGQLHVEVRRHALHRFLLKFRKNNPYYRTAYNMWKDLDPAVLEINTLPEGALVAINGTVVGSAPLRREVKEGNYHIVASRSGFVTSAQNISVTKGQSAVVSLFLSRKVKEHPFNTWGHVTFWSGLGLVAFGGASMGLSVKYANDFESSGLPDDADRSNTWSTMMWLGFGSGSVLMVAGAVLWLLEPPASERIDPSTVTSLLPTPDGQGALLSISGAW